MRGIFLVITIWILAVPAMAAQVRKSPVLARPAQAGGVLQIEGLDGEGPGHGISVQSFSFSMERPDGSPSGRSTVAAQFGDLVIHKQVDVTSPDLATLLASGRHIPMITLQVQRAGRLYEIQLRDVMVSALQQVGWNEEVKFRYGRIHWAYSPNEDAEPMGRGWNLESNRAE